MSTIPESAKGDDGDAAVAAGWEPELEELRRRQRFVAEMGGPEKVARHHGQGKLTVRERVDGLLDPGTFHEIGSVTGVASYDGEGRLTGLRPANFIYGRGDLDGRRVVVEGDDFTVRGGAADASIWDKMVAAEQMACELRLPLVRLVDGTGGGGSVKTIETDGRTYVSQAIGWEHAVANLATVPVIGLGLGSIAGLGSARLVTSHYSVLVRGTSQVFVAGPPVVARIGETVDKEELGRADLHAGIGAVDAVVDSEAEAFAHARRFLSYLPQSVYDLPPRGPTDDDPARREDWLIRAIPRDRRKVYRMRPIIEALVDREFVLRDREGVGAFAHHRARPPRRLAGRDRRGRPLLLRRRVDGGRLPQGDPLHRARRDLPPPGGAPRGHPGLPHRHPGGAGRDHPARRPGPRVRVPDHRALVQHHRAQVLRGGGGPPT